jgi:hypothetical protein
MSYTFLLEQGEESLVECYSDIPAYVLARLNITEGECFCNGNGTESCQSFQSGTTLGHSTENRGEEKSMSCAQEYHAKELAQQDRQTGQHPDSLIGTTTSILGGWWAKWEQHSCSWRTCQCSLLGGLEPFWETFPQWGMMAGGAFWGLATPVIVTGEEESGRYLPTPSGTNGGTNHTVGRLDEWGGASNPWRGTKIGSVRCPRFEEWMMGWPIAWTELTPYETDKFQQWLNSHGKP